MNKIHCAGGKKLILTRASKLIPKIHYTKEFAQMRRGKKVCCSW